MDESTNRDALEQALSRITEQELTRNERYGHVVLAAFSGIFTVGIISLLVTEPFIRQRALVSFLVMAGIGLAWVTYAIGVLLRRRPLLANREIVAGRMSVFFCSLFTLGAMLVGFSVRHKVLYTGAVGLGLTMTAIAVALLIRAHLRRASLRALRAKLESELAGARM
jgi:hypothetical protein